MAAEDPDPQIHPMAFRTEEIDILVAEHRVLWDDIKPLVETIAEGQEAMARDVTLIVSELYGDPKPTAADPDARQGGAVAVLEDIRDDLMALMNAAENGGLRSKRTWGVGEWAVAAAFIALCGTSIAAIVTLVSVMVSG